MSRVTRGSPQSCAASPRSVRVQQRNFSRSVCKGADRRRFVVPEGIGGRIEGGRIRLASPSRHARPGTRAGPHSLSRGARLSLVRNRSQVMDPVRVLRRFDQEMRRDPHEVDGYCIEKSSSIVRLVSPADVTVLYSRVSPAKMREFVAGQLADFRARHSSVEWKIYSHDRPPGLSRLLSRAGFKPDPTERLMVFDLHVPYPGRPSANAPEIRRVHGGAGLRDFFRVNRAAFGRSDPVRNAYLRTHRNDPHLGLFVAYIGSRPVSSGRVEVTPGRSFAGIYGGGTDPAFRGRGIYQQLVRARADFARDAGSRYLYVEAVEETSRPILERVGFVPLASVVGWVRSFRGSAP